MVPSNSEIQPAHIASSLTVAQCYYLGVIYCGSWPCHQGPCIYPFFSIKFSPHIHLNRVLGLLPAHGSEGTHSSSSLFVFSVPFRLSWYNSLKSFCVSTCNWLHFNPLTNLFELNTFLLGSLWASRRRNNIPNTQKP